MTMRDSKISDKRDVPVGTMPGGVRQRGASISGNIYWVE
jgi:hypothetical protein